MFQRQRTLIFIAALASIAALIACFLFPLNRFETKSERVSTETTQTQTTDSVPSKKSVVIPEDFDWTEQDEAWLDELVEQVQPPEESHSHWKYEFDEILQPGESLITDGWEMSEGVFQFTILTPNMVESDGEIQYAITADITEVNVSGDIKEMAMPQVLTAEGMEASVTISQGQPVGSNGEAVGLPDKKYQLSFTPEGVTNGIRLKGSATAVMKNP